VPNTAPLAATTAVLDAQMHRHLGPGIQIFGTAILVKHTERGWLYVLSRDPEYSWTETRQKLVRLVADQTAVAIENDELAVELKKKERLDQELEIGAEIQRRLLPRQCPNIPGVSVAACCKPANRVGGDYYDFIPVSHPQIQHYNNGNLFNGRWGLVIGDVMGKGVPPGLIMTMMRGALRAEVLHSHSPAKILKNLNQLMYADLENSHRFITMFYSEYNPKSQVLHYSNAAHNPPLWWHAATKTVTRLDTLGMLIALDANSQYEDAQAQLEPGNIVIYYTNALTDAEAASGERFDEENLIAEFISACQICNGSQEILDYLFEQVQQFVGEGKQNTDDMTLIVLQVQ
jgi:sigma-B regulation protein RsbU (phosphoserine phosphatase)